MDENDNNKSRKKTGNDAALVVTTKQRRPRRRLLWSWMLIVAMLITCVIQLFHYHQLATVYDGSRSGGGGRDDPHPLDPAAWKLVKKESAAAVTQPEGQLERADHKQEQPAPKTQQQQAPKLHPLLQLIQDANILPNHMVMNTSTTANQELLITSNSTNDESITLPAWSTLQAVYGDLNEPVIIGLETCETYRQQVPPPNRYTAVAGSFNTGTNAMEFHLQHNIPGVPHTWQVPWGKHRMPFLRLQHVAPGMEHRDQTQVLPVVMIRDPFHWMQSMCKSPYAAHWQHSRKHCPNLVSTDEEVTKFGDTMNQTNGSVPIHVKFSSTQIYYWDSLIHFYNDYYQQYYFNATYPRLMVRFEDMLLMPQTVLSKIAACVGVEPTTSFQYQAASAKGHGSHTTMLSAIVKTANAQKRINALTREDLQFAAKHLNSELMRVFQYRLP